MKEISLTNKISNYSAMPLFSDRNRSLLLCL